MALLTGSNTRLGTLSDSTGITLLELLFVLVLLGIFSTALGYFYLDYVSRAQMTAALAEITPGKQAVELHLSEGLDAPLHEPQAVGLANSRRCQLRLGVGTGGAALIRCTLQGSAIISGRALQWVRDPGSNPAGAWHCETNLPLSPLPAACDHLATEALAQVPTID